MCSTQQQTQNFELVANKELYCQVVGDGRGNSVLGLALGFSGFSGFCKQHQYYLEDAAKCDTSWKEEDC